MTSTALAKKVKEGMKILLKDMEKEDLKNGTAIAMEMDFVIDKFDDLFPMEG